MKTEIKTSKVQEEVWEWKEKASEELNKISKNEEINILNPAIKMEIK